MLGQWPMHIREHAQERILRPRRQRRVRGSCQLSVHAVLAEYVTSRPSNMIRQLVMAFSRTRSLTADEASGSAARAAQRS